MTVAGAGKMGLGSVQWGSAYGVANAAGVVPSATEVGGMLGAAHEAGITLLDTAWSYGNAEFVIGQHAAAVRGWQIITKAPDAAELGLTEAFDQSLQRMHRENVHGLLLHDADGLLTPDGRRLWSALQAIRARGLAMKIGVSVYDPHQLERILDAYPIDIVQLPFNLFDQRFLRAGLLDRLRCDGIEVHTRSAFLQGVLLMPLARLPQGLSGLRGHHQNLQRALEKSGATPLAASLRFCLEQPQIDRVIVGCESRDQLDAILKVAAMPDMRLAGAEMFAVDDEALIDPRRWART